MLSVAASNQSLHRIWAFKVALLLLFMLPTILWTACRKSPEVIKVGLVGPFSGRNRQIGYDVIYGARLAVREINGSSDMGNYRLALVALDDFGDPEMAELNALTLIQDPDVIVVMGHWLPHTTDIALPIYESSEMPVIETGTDPFGPQDPASLPRSFWVKYTELTPFDEVPGPYAGSGYDAIRLINSGVKHVIKEGSPLTRSSLSAVLERVTIDGLTGQVRLQPRE